MTKKTLWGTGVCLSLGLCLSMLTLVMNTASADGFRPRIGTVMEGVGAILTVNDHAAASLRAGEGGYAPAMRIAAAAARLQSLVAGGVAAGEMAPIKTPGGSWGVGARGVLILLASPGECRAQRQNSIFLARQWAVSLRHFLSQPPITLSVDGLTVPLGETRRISVGGAVQAKDVQAFSQDANVAPAQFDPAQRILTVTGHTAGRTSLAVVGEGASISLPVRVLPYAASVQTEVTAAVTGVPAAPPDVVTQAVYGALARAVIAQPGAQLRLPTPPAITDALAAGTQVSVRVPVELTGADMLPVLSSVRVTVSNLRIAPRPAIALFYSNNPEQVKTGQELFAGQIEPNQPVRLDYHHQNMSVGALVFHADLVNEGDQPASVQVISGLSLPGADTVQVGRRAGAAFLQAADSGIGLVLPVPPHARVPVLVQRFAVGLTVSGVVQLQQTSGAADSLSLRVSAVSDAAALSSPVGRLLLTALSSGTTASPILDAPAGLADGGGAFTPSPYVFAAPQLFLSGSYKVGGAWAYVRIGQAEALSDRSGRFKLFGNYGADYEITLTLSNPSILAKPVGLFFAPEAGLAAGVFRVDSGPFQELNPIGPPQEPLLARWTLAPGEIRTVRVQTLPLNGSSYPASLIVHSLP